MSLIKDLNIYITNILESLGFQEEAIILPSSRRELGEFQLNVSFNIAKKYGKNPYEVSKEIISKLDERFVNVNIANGGFINFSLRESVLTSYADLCMRDFSYLIDKVVEKNIFIDYGGANVAKTLHVGHMRSANIGEALKRLLKLFGYSVISDVHLGDIGRQSGMIIAEIKERMPNLGYFDANYQGEDIAIPFTPEELDKMYPISSLKAKEDETRMEEAREITALIEKGHLGYTNLWSKIKNESVKTIRKTYELLNTSFDLWEGELDSYQYLDKTLEKCKEFLVESDGALVIVVSEDSDKVKVPPLIMINSKGGTNYETREVATLYSRIERFNPDKILYVVDTRQDMHFKQTFRVGYKTGIVPIKTSLEFLNFGTMNGSDNKPFKTRDGEVLDLNNLYNQVYKVCYEKLSNIEGKENTARIVTVATLKYADLLPFRTTDYIFDIDKMTSLEGKTGPYILYTMVRINSLLNKNIDNTYKINSVLNEEIHDILLKVAVLPSVLKTSLDEYSLNHITDYLYQLCNLYNRVYNNYNITNETNKENKETLLGISKLVYNIGKNLLDVLAIEVPERM